jgi:transcriptional regulator of arginine metabolism
MTAPRTMAARRARIVQLIESRVIESQEDLVQLLAKEGMRVTQATVSRDLDDLGAHKVPGEHGSLHYVVGERIAGLDSRLHKLLPDVLVAAEGSANIAVLRTPPGAAQYLASAIDHAEHDEVLRTVAGDDTVFVVTRSATGGAALAQEFVEHAHTRRG